MNKNGYYEYKSNNKLNFDDNNTILNVSKNNIIVKNTEKIKIDKKPNKYKILLITNTKDFINFYDKYINKNKMNKLMTDYAGVVIEQRVLHSNNLELFYWIEDYWYTDYGYVWRFNISILSY